MHSLILDILVEQTVIGWLPGIKGFLSSKWLNLAQLSTDPTINVSLDVGRDRICHLPKSWSRLTTTIWKGRNEVLHGTSISHSNNPLDCEIRHYHSKPELLALSDRHYCSRSLDCLLKATPANKHRWVKQIRLTRHRRLTDQLPQSRLLQFLPCRESAPLPPRIPVTMLTQLPVVPPTQVSIHPFFCPQPTCELDHSPAPLPAPPPHRVYSILLYFCPKRYEMPPPSAIRVGHGRELPLIAAKASSHS